MKRRGFLGFIGGAAVAGPSMAKAAAVQGMEAMSLGNAVSLSGLADSVGIASEGQRGLYPDELHPTDPKHWVQRQLQEFMGRSAEELLEQRLNTSVHALDPDLAVSRSLSLDAKIRMQRDRNFERNQADCKRTIMRDLQRSLKSWHERL